MLNGRAAEQAAIDRLLDAARAGASGALVLRGDAGIGKTALLDYAAAAAAGFQVIRGTGIESEAELPFAGLHLLLRPALDRIGALPVPQRQAVEGAFGLAPAPPGDPLLIGMAVLSLLSELAGDGPLLCLVDDAHWLDGSSAAALAFAARRLGEEGIALIMAARDGEGRFPASGLPELRVAGLAPESAAALLDAQPADLTAALRYRILAEAQGNPLALIELPPTHLPDPLHGQPAIEDPGELALTGRLLAAFSGQAARLPDATRLLLLVAAADDAGEAGLVLRAGRALGADAADLAPAERAGLIRHTGQSLAFRHPLIRAAVYQEAPLGQRLAVHRALADAMDGREGSDDAGRRAWHRAAGAAQPDEQIAAGLDRAAEQAAERGGYAAAAAASARAAELSADPAARARRLTIAAEAAAESGDLTRARALAGRAEPDAGDAMLRAGLLHVRALADFGEGSFRGAHRLLLEGADLLAGTSPVLAARILVQAFHTAWYIGEPELADVAGRLTALRLPDGEPMQPVAGYLAATLGTLFGWRADGIRGVPALTDAVGRARRAGADAPLDLVQVCGAGLIAGQDAQTHEVAAALAAEAREQGRIGLLPTVLFFLAEAELFHGRHRDALATAAEAVQVASDSGQWHWVSQVSGLLAYLAAAAGDEARCRKLADDAMTAATAGNVAPGSAWAHWSLGLLDLGGGRVEAALGRLTTLAEGPARHHVSVMRSAPDLVEAAVRIGAPGRAAGPLQRFERWAGRAGQPWIDALVLRCRALLAPDPEAESLYAAALDAHQRDDRPFERARTHSLYGEWLRRARRKTEARTQLRAALEIFDRLGAEPWSGRAATELRATGVATPEGRGPGALGQLTPQELQIVRLAARGLSNRDIAAQLFLSPRTVGYHLYKAYPKLGVAARSELPALLYDET